MSHATVIIVNIMAFGLLVLAFRFFSFIGFHLLKMAAGAVLLVFISLLVLPVNMLHDILWLFHQVAPDAVNLLRALHFPL